MDTALELAGPAEARQSPLAAHCRSQLVPIADLSEDDSPRTGPLDESHVSALVEVLSGLPPVLVHRQTFRVIDGRHRVSAARRQGARHVLVEFFDGGAEDAFVEAVRRNARHGLPLTLAERRAAARRILASHPHWSDGVIADHACLSTSTVAALRRCGDGELALVRRGRDGRSRPVDGSSRRRVVEQFFLEHPDGSLRQAAKAADVSPSTAKLVRDAMRQARPRASCIAAFRVDGAASPVAEVVASSSSSIGPPLRGSTTTKGTGMGELPTASILQRLSEDPSVRASEDGRMLLRVIGLSLTLSVQPGRVPPHRRAAVAVLARRCADRWSAYASSLECPR